MKQFAAINKETGDIQVFYSFSKMQLGINEDEYIVRELK